VLEIHFNSNKRWKNYCKRGVGRSWARHVARMGEKGVVWKFLVRKH